MNLQSRIRKIEIARERRFDEWLNSLSDEELETIARSRGENTDFRDWLKTLTDEEVETLRHNRTSASRLREKFNEYQKQNQEN